MQFSGLMFINSSWNMYSSQNSLQVSGGFIMFSRGKEKHRECDQSLIIGDIPIPFKPEALLLTQE